MTRVNKIALLAASAGFALESGLAPVKAYANVTWALNGLTTTTGGTVTVVTVGPPLTTRSTRLFFATLVPAAGSIEITIGDDNHPATALWYREPKPVSAAAVKKADGKKEAFQAGATMTTAAASQGIPLLLPKDAQDANDSFLTREAKFARRWLYSKGIMAPEEDRNPVTIELEEFFLCCKDPVTRKPKSNLEIGLNDSTAVILSNLAMDEHRRVDFSEIQTMGRGDAKKKA